MNCCRFPVSSSAFVKTTEVVRRPGRVSSSQLLTGLRILQRVYDEISA
jgi:hypothetical protein